MAKSEKPVVIERIFDTLYDPLTGTLSRTVVNNEDVQNAKQYCLEKGLITKLKAHSNPFNFMKDIVRGKGASKMWPRRIYELGFTGEQRTGDGAIFEFVPISEGGQDGLEEDFLPSPNTPEYPLQSLSIPLASRMLGRSDESWLLQVAVNLRIIESHFSAGDNKQVEAVELYHLQMDIKLRKVQIDALFLAHYETETGKKTSSTLITVEAKREGQRILSEQIKRQVIAAFSSTDEDLVIPVAISAIRNKGVFVVEFKAVHRSELASFSTPIFHRDAMFVLQPAVPGI